MTRERIGRSLRNSTACEGATDEPSPRPRVNSGRQRPRSLLRLGCQSMLRRRRPPSIAAFVRAARALTALFAAPIVGAVALAAAPLGRWAAVALAALPLAVVLVGVGPRVRLGLLDSPRPRWVGRLAAPLFDVLWTTALLSPATLVISAIAATITAAVGGAALSAAHVFEGGALLSATLAAYGVLVRRRWVRVRRLEVPLSDLPQSLDGYRIAHLSDLHIGSLARAEEARAWVLATNRLGADLVAVTGDMVSTGSAFHGEVVEVLAELRARDGVVACLGNHDYYDEDALCRALAEVGVRVLRNEGIVVGAEAAALFVAGVEDLWRGKVDLVAALADRGDEPALLLAHNPELFPAAAAAGADLILAGHTHAGQIAVPFFAERLGLARLSTRFQAGLFARGDAKLFVHAGLGTTGPAIRLGAAPEIVELVLRRA